VEKSEISAHIQNSKALTSPAVAYIRTTSASPLPIAEVASPVESELDAAAPPMNWKRHVPTPSANTACNGNEAARKWLRCERGLVGGWRAAQLSDVDLSPLTSLSV